MRRLTAESQPNEIGAGYNVKDVGPRFFPLDKAPNRAEVLKASHLFEDVIENFPDVASLDRVRLDHAAGAVVEGRRQASFPSPGRQKPRN